MTDFKLPKGVSLHRGKLRIAFRPHGFKNQVKRSLALLPTKANIKVAEQKLRAIQYDIMANRFVIDDYFANDPISQIAPLYIKDVLIPYFLDRGRWKGSTHDIYVSAVSVLTAEVGDKDLRTLTNEGALLIQNRLSKSKKATVYAGRRGHKRVNLLIGILRKTTGRLVLAGKVDKNPFLHLEALAPEKDVTADSAALTDLDVFTTDEAKMLCESLRSVFHQRLFTFLFWSGVRHGEAAALKREDICLPYIVIRRTLTQKGKKQSPKTGRARKILLPSLAISAITKQMSAHSHEHIWTNTLGMPLPTSIVIQYSTWYSELKRVGLRKLVPYVTRHSFASWMLKARENEARIADHLGHASVSELRKTYGHFIPETQPVWSLDDPVLTPLEAE